MLHFFHRQSVPVRVFANRPINCVPTQLSSDSKYRCSAPFLFLHPITDTDDKMRQFSHLPVLHGSMQDIHEKLREDFA